MLNVKSPQEAQEIISAVFKDRFVGNEFVNTDVACGRVLFENVCANEYVPGFNRSTVDGYAVVAASTFGCSESLPAVLNCSGEILMGEKPSFGLSKDSCAYIPTGGELPDGADAVVMLEQAEAYKDGSVGMLSPAAPLQNVILKGGDVKPGDLVLKAGARIRAKDIGILAALGISSISVYKKPVVSVISTGNELVDISEKAEGAKIRDVNSHMLCRALEESGCTAQFAGIIRDDAEEFEKAMRGAAEKSDLIIVSGGSSVGVKDLTLKTVEKLGEVYIHGIAIKPGKPSIFGEALGKPFFGLPGNPLAAFFIFELFVRPALLSLQNMQSERPYVSATLSTAIPSNHGRAECMPVKLIKNGSEWIAEPLFNKSGLIGVLAPAQGCILIDRNCEGLSKGESVKAILF